jgi:hypothetical protein
MTRRPFWPSALFACIAALVAWLLFIWGSAIWTRTGVPLAAIGLEVLYLPAAATADRLWRGHLTSIYVASGLQWPLIAGVVRALSGVVSGPPWRARAYVWGSALLVPVLPALFFAAPVLRVRILVWWAAWFAAALAMGGAHSWGSARRARHSGEHARPRA